MSCKKCGSVSRLGPNCYNCNTPYVVEDHPPENPLDVMVICAPFSARMMELGAPVWFVVDKNEKWLCQATPSGNEQAARDIAELMNKGAGHI